LRRSGLLDGANEARKARVDANRAMTLAEASKNLSQQLRARLTLASITATEGRSSDAVDAATSAVTDALRAGLDLVAAEGLIDLAGTFMDLERLAEADPALQRAARIADGLGARRTAARARAQLAELRRMQGDSNGAIELVDQVLPFFHDRHYRRLELTSLLIKARADNALGRIQQARDLSANVLTLAEAVKDDARIALAASDTAAGDTQLGRYPEALGLRERAESIYRRQGDDTSLPYTLVNRAELLIRLGRQGDASRVLSEVEAGAARGLDAYKGRTPRVAFLKMLAAATSLRCGEALQLAVGARAPEDRADSAGGVAEALEYFCAARLGRQPRQPGISPEKSAIARAERALWLANGALAARDSRAAAATASEGLSALGDLPNDDLRWTLAATGLIAARSLRERDLEARMSSVYHTSFERLQKNWASDFALYVARSDLRELRTRASEH